MMDAASFAERRSRVLEALGADSALVLAAAPELRVGPDAELRYLVDADLFYLTGYTEPEAVAVLCPAHETPFTLFVRPRDPDRELWTGVRGGVEAALDAFGADAAIPVAELSARLFDIVSGVDTLYARFGTGRPDVDAALHAVLERGRRNRPRRGRGARAVVDQGALLDEMRLVKEPVELDAMREAVRISVDGFRAAARLIRPGAGEWRIEAELDAAFRGAGGDGAAFPTIVAGGANATVLHYVANRCPLRSGDLVLLDAGARYSMYCADITRTMPVSGEFAPAQLSLYSVVLEARDAAIAAVRPGATIEDVHFAALRVLVGGMIEHGLLAGDVESLMQQKEEVRRFYPHRTSHWLGLDVHDVGDYVRDGAGRALVPGMVLTVEPGLYIGVEAADAAAELRGTGIRIEDDVLVTADGHEVLTAALPAEPDALLELMH